MQKQPGQDQTPKTVRLYECHKGDAAAFVDAAIRPDGSLQVLGDDIGPDLEQFCGKDEYEYDLTLNPEAKDQLLLALVVDRFGGNPRAFHNLEEYLKAKAIPYDFNSWP